VALGRPWAIAALAPRAVQLALVRRPRAGRTSPSVVGVRETLMLAAVVGVVVMAV
jgi:hypothetical protein